MNQSLLACVCGVVAFAGSSALGQFSADLSTNFKIADRSGDQVQPKVRPVPGGGVYVSWFDNSSGGYDVYLQRLNAQGVEQWAHQGLLIADRAVSSTVDYDLAVDADGNAILAYNDDGGVSGTPQQISVQKVDRAGNLLWGAHGVAISSDSGSKSNPKIAALSDGNTVVAYSNGTPSPGVWVMQKLSGAGVPQWAGSGVVVAESGHYLAASDAQAGADGSVIVLWIRAFTTSLTSKYLLAMRYDASGAPVWTPTTVSNGLGPVSGVVVYMPAPGSSYTTLSGTGTYSATQGGSIQNGYQPSGISDGAGGVVYSWYENAGPRNAYLQHILADGTLKFQQGGVSTALTALSPNGRIRLGAGAAYDRVNLVYYVASPESANPTQGNYSVVVQKFDDSGARVWGDSGVTVFGPDSSGKQASFVQCQLLGAGALASFIWQNSSGPSNGALYAALTSGGSTPTTAFVTNVSTQDVPKSRLASTATSCGDNVVLAFGNGAVGGATDIAVQNVNADGTFGPGIACPVFTAQPAATARPCTGATLTLAGNASNAPCYQWNKGGVALSNSARISGANSGMLTITGVRAADAGTYTLVASNSCGDASSNAAVVTVCAADYDCSGVLSVNDIFDFLAGWFAGNPRADFNGVGGLGVQDIFDFLAAWFAGC